MDQSGTSDPLFHPPGCDPFPSPSYPTTFYHPSNSTQQRFDSSKIVLTPEKRKKFDVKDNESYAPLNYSFTGVEEEQEDTTTEKEESVESNILESFSSLLHSETSTSNTETQDSNSSGEDSYQVIERVTKTPSDGTSLLYDRDTVTSNKSLASLPPKTPKPEMSSTQNSSNPSSNVSILLNRFRYGKPQPRNERRPPSKPSPLYSKPPLSTDHRKYDWQAEETEKSTADYMDSLKANELGGDDSFAEFQKKVEEVLQRSMPSPLKLPGMRLDTSKPSSNETAVVDSAGRPESISTPHEISQAEQTARDKKIPEGKPHVSFQEDTRTHPHHQPSAELSSSPISEYGTGDILHQWRLRRKIEEARKHQNLHGFPGSAFRNQPDSYFPAERPFSHDAPSDDHPTGSATQQPVYPSPILQQPTCADLPQVPIGSSYANQQPTAAGSAVHQPVYPGSYNQQPGLPVYAGQHPYYPGMVFQQPYFPGVANQPTCLAASNMTPHIPQPTAPMKPDQICQTNQPCGQTPCHQPIVLGHTPADKAMSMTSAAAVAVDTACAETQTTPKSSRSSSTLLSDLETKESPISMQKVTIVDAKASSRSQKSVVSPTSSASTRSSTATRGKPETSKSKKGKARSKKHEQSPTTTVLKKVIVSRLFDESGTSTPCKLDTTDETVTKSVMSVSPDHRKGSERSEHSCDERNTFGDKSSENSTFGTPRWSEKSSSKESKKTQEFGSPQDVLNQLLQSIEIEELDFEDDPVLKSLRSQREDLLTQLRSVEKQLEDDAGNK